MADQISRRRFLGGAVRTGVGAAVASSGVLGASLRSVADAAPLPHAAPPAPPAPLRRYVSRPDLVPPGVSVSTLAGHGHLPSEPQYLFAAVTSATGQYPAGAQRGLMITTRLGDLVWFHPVPATTANQVFNFRKQSYRGRPVLSWWQGTLGAGFGTGGTYHVMDDAYSPVTTAHAVGYPSDLHEFLITPQDTALVTAYDVQDHGALVVCHAQEIDLGSNDLVWDWACYPAVPRSDGYISPTLTGDYFHLNSVDLWPGSERNVLISAKNTSTVYLISRSTKQILWQAGGKRSSFDMVGLGTRFEYQHDARALADGSGFSLFDDASAAPPRTPTTPEKQSWGKVLTLDTAKRQVTLRHQYNNTNMTIDTSSQGNCQLLPTGGHFVGYGAVNAFSEFGPSGSEVEGPMILDGRFPTGVESYRTFLFDWVGSPPRHELALVVHRGSAPGSFTAWVSWNGATEVATWRVFAGSSSSHLRPVAHARKTTFETRASFTASGATEFQVAAYSASGALLGRSSVVRAS